MPKIIITGKIFSVTVTGPVVAQRVGRGIDLFFHDQRHQKGVSVQQHAPAVLYPRERPGTHCTNAGWASGLVWTGGKSRPTGIRSPDRPARSRSLYRLSYPAHRKTLRYWDITKFYPTQSTKEKIFSPVWHRSNGSIKTTYKNKLTYTTRL